MKRIYIIIAVMLMGMAAKAQEGKPFVTASLGTQGTGDVFRGAAVSLGAGYNWKGLDMGLALLRGGHPGAGTGHPGPACTVCLLIIA